MRLLHEIILVDETVLQNSACKVPYEVADWVQGLIEGIEFESERRYAIQVTVDQLTVMVETR